MNPVQIPIEFSNGESGKSKTRPKDTDTIKWKVISEKEYLEKVKGYKPVFDNKITVYKINPCYVCVDGVCYWSNNC